MINVLNVKNVLSSIYNFVNKDNGLFLAMSYEPRAN